MKTELRRKKFQMSGAIASAVGLVVAFTLFGFMLNGYHMLEYDNIWAYSIFAGIVMIMAAVWISGKIAGLGARSRIIYVLAGAGSSLFCLAVASLSGSLVFTIVHFASIRLSELHIYLFAPLFWVGLFGTLPAAIMGGLWGALVHSKWNS